MYSILREFASGNINPAEHSRKRSREFEKAAKTLMEAEGKLLAVLNENEKKLYDEFTDAQMKLSTLEEVEKFIQGYILGSSMTMEVMTGIEGVITF